MRVFAADRRPFKTAHLDPEDSDPEDSDPEDSDPEDSDPEDSTQDFQVALSRMLRVCFCVRMCFERSLASEISTSRLQKDSKSEPAV